MNNSQTFDAGWNQASGTAASQAVTATAQEGQYSLFKILAIWAAAVVPMVVLGWIAAPLVGDQVDLGLGSENNVAIMRAILLTAGLIWQFVLSMGIILREEGDLRWSTIKARCWLNTPRDPRTGEERGRLWWWLVPFALLAVIIVMIPLDNLWNSALPFLGEPDKYSFEALLDSDARKAQIEGAWWVLGFFIVLGVFNTVLGEELLFRGILLPRMSGTFGKLDWLANGILFGLYHLHQPWSIISSAIGGSLTYAYPSRRFRSAWFGIIIHSLETVFFIFIVTGLVLGLA